MLTKTEMIGRQLNSETVGTRLLSDELAHAIPTKNNM